MKRKGLVISCFYDSLNEDSLPTGFSWAKTLATTYKNKYKITILLHGENIKYGLKSSVYENNFGVPNPYESFLYELKNKNKVNIVICHLCLENDGYTKKNVLEFIKLIDFSIDYIAQSQLKGKFVIYDAQLPFVPSSINKRNLPTV